MLTLAFGLAAWLSPRLEAQFADRADLDDPLAVLLGDSRVLFANSFFVRADACFYSGYLSLASLSLSLFFALRGMRAKGYADYPRGNKLWDNLKPENVSEDAAQEALVQLLLQTREQNARLNDVKINSLFWCGWLLFVGFLLVAGSQLLDAFVDTMT